MNEKRVVVVVIIVVAWWVTGWYKETGRVCTIYNFEKRLVVGGVFIKLSLFLNKWQQGVLSVFSSRNLVVFDIKRCFKCFRFWNIEFIFNCPCQIICYSRLKTETESVSECLYSWMAMYRTTLATLLDSHEWSLCFQLHFELKKPCFSLSCGGQCPAIDRCRNGPKLCGNCTWRHCRWLGSDSESWSQVFRWTGHQKSSCT